MSHVIQSAGLAQQASASAAATTKPGLVAAPPVASGHRPAAPSPLSSAFCWHSIPSTSPAPGLCAYEQAEFAACVQDVSRGLQDVLAIIEQDKLDEGGKDSEGQPLRPVLSLRVTQNLMRLCVAALGMLGDKAELTIERVQQCADEERGHV